MFDIKSDIKNCILLITGMSSTLTREEPSKYLISWRLKAVGMLNVGTIIKKNTYCKATSRSSVAAVSKKKSDVIEDWNYDHNFTYRPSQSLKNVMICVCQKV